MCTPSPHPLPDWTLPTPLLPGDDEGGPAGQDTQAQTASVTESDWQEQLGGDRAGDSWVFAYLCSQLPRALSDK